MTSDVGRAGQLLRSLLLGAAVLLAGQPAQAQVLHAGLIGDNADRPRRPNGRRGLPSS